MMAASSQSPRPPGVPLPGGGGSNPVPASHGVVSAPEQANPPQVATVDRCVPPAGPTGRTWTIPLPAGQELLNANQRMHWTKRARITKQIRSDAFYLAKYAKVPHLQRARVICVVEPAPAHRRRDPGNWSPSAKAAVDGLVDAGVLPDDDDKHLLGPDMRMGDPYPSGRLVLIITELDGERS